jgi:hypothetical protein
MSQIPSTRAARPRLSARIAAELCCALLCLWTNGCAATPYTYGRFHPDQPEGVDIQPLVVEHGTPNKTLDRIGWVVGAPARLLTLNKNVNNHKISPETLEKLRLYLERNDITDVFVAVDVYDPKGQWKRLRENDTMSPVWRYSFGVLNWLGYTVLPNRVFGGDRYNAFTNTLNLSSDVPAMVLEEAAYAKDIHGQRNPGVYASFVNDMPVLAVYRQAKATSDLLGYARTHDDWPVEKQAYQVMYPQIGFGVIGPAGTFIPVVGPYIDIGGAVAGHAVGRTVAAIRESNRPKPPEPAPEAPDGPDIAPLVIASKHESERSDAEDLADNERGVVPASFETPAVSDSKR